MKGRRRLQAAVVSTALATAGLLGMTTASGRRRTSEAAGGNGRALGDRPLQTGVITFLMTDVAGSTRMWEERPEVAGAVLERHEALIRALVHQHGGELIQSRGEGDSTFSVFPDACEAASAAVEIHRALQRESWPEGATVRVRAALYTGQVERRHSHHHGPVPNRCARLRAAAHPGQTVCSQSTQACLADLATEIIRTDLGLHRLRDVIRPEHIFQLGHRDLPAAFPPLRTLAVRTIPLTDHARPVASIDVAGGAAVAS
jgi:class 3 adenylate cyclase